MSITQLETPTRIGPEHNGMMMTVEEYDSIEEWDPFYSYELVHGVLIVMPPPGPGERSPNDKLGRIILNFQADHPNGDVVDETLPEQEIATTAGRRRTDRVIWLGLGRAPITGVARESDVPKVAIELVSQSSRDRRRDYVEKREEYADAGVEEYWVIDRYRRKMTVFRGRDEELVLGEGETYRPEIMPGFELPLDYLLAAADRYRNVE